MTSRRAWRAAAALALATIAAYIAVWAQVSPLEVGRSDFTSTYVGATLLRAGDRAHIYDESAQSRLHSQLIAPDREGNLPFVDAPVAAALAAPVTLLDLATAYRLWGLVQLALLALSVLIALRAAPWPRGTPAPVRVAGGALALAGAGTLVGLLQAQWGGVSALGLALAYSDWRRGRHARGAALLVIAAGIAKPHLAVGLVAFMLGWRNRRVLLGAVAGAAGVALASLAVAGPSGVVAFFSLALQSNTRWQLRTFSGIVGIPGSFLGNSGAAQLIGVAGSVVALAFAAYLGSLVRHHHGRLEPALAGAAALSVLAAPHAGIHDLVLLAPAAAWMFGWAAARDVMHAGDRATTAVAVTTTWLAISLASFISLADGGSLPPGQLVPWALIAAALLSIWVAREAPRLHAEHPLTSARDATAVGAVEDGVRRRSRLHAGRVLPVPRRG